jgi:hypothetical protein
MRRPVGVKWVLSFVRWTRFFSKEIGGQDLVKRKESQVVDGVHRFETVPVGYRSDVLGLVPEEYSMDSVP